MLSTHRTMCRYVWAWAFVTSPMGLVFLEPGGRGTASLSNVDFTAFTGNLVSTRLLVSRSSILVRGEDRLECGGGTMPQLNINPFPDPLEFLGSGPQKRKDDSRFGLVLGGIAPGR